MYPFVEGKVERLMMTMRMKITPDFVKSREGESAEADAMLPLAETFAHLMFWMQETGASGVPYTR